MHVGLIFGGLGNSCQSYGCKWCIHLTTIIIFVVILCISCKDVMFCVVIWVLYGWCVDKLMRSIRDTYRKDICGMLWQQWVKETIGYGCKSSGVIEFCVLLSAAVIFDDFNTISTVSCVFASVNGWSIRRRSDWMGWVDMVIMMCVVGSGWYKHCKWVTSAVMWECLVMMEGESSSVGGRGACEVSVLLCWVWFSVLCGMWHAVFDASMMVMTGWLLLLHSLCWVLGSFCWLVLVSNWLFRISNVRYR